VTVPTGPVVDLSGAVVFDPPDSMPGVGVIAPFDFALDDEYWRWLAQGVTLYITRTPYDDHPVSVEMAEAVSNTSDVAVAARALTAVRPAATVYACTSGSFVAGLAGERALREAMAGAGLVNPMTTSGALVEALTTLGARRVAIGSPYDAELTRRLARFLAEAGYEVVGGAFLGLDDKIAQVNARSVYQLAQAADSAGADAVFLSCTNLRTFDVLAAAERDLGKPVLSANQVSMWAALRASRLPAAPVEQSLFATAASRSAPAARLSAKGEGEPAVAVVCSGPDSQPPDLTRRLAGQADIRPVFDTPALREVINDADAVFVWDFCGTQLRDAWGAATRVRWVHVASAGVDPLLFPELRDSSVVVTNSRGVFDQAIAEFVLGAVLAFAKDLPATLALQREHTWRHRETRLVAGSTALVVGAGSIGRAAAGLLRAAGCRVVGIARATRDDPAFDRVAAVADFGSELPDADYVVVAAPLTEQTRGLVGAEAFKRMKPTAVLINVGRGPIVDEDALLAALDAGQVAGAVLDVFGEEPLPTGHPFWDHPRIIVSPHMCGDFQGYTNTLVDLFVDNFTAWRSGRPLRNVVDKRRGY
jgi:phosphoglycerate dehydrogenase-like enzyme/maleate cis-trans isomerase